jgi:hypothetical protein
MASASRVPREAPQRMNPTRLRPRVVGAPGAGWLTPTIFAGIGAVVLIAIACVMSSRAAASREAAKRQAELNALATVALGVAEKLRPVAQEYLDFRKAHPKEVWPQRKLEYAALGLPAGLAVEDVLLLHDVNPVASLSGSPRRMGGAVEASPEPGVDILNGPYETATGGTVPCLQFRVGLTFAGAGEKFSACLIVRRAAE